MSGFTSLPVVKRLLLGCLVAGGLAFVGVARADQIGPPVNTKGSGWVASCVHPDHPASYDPSTACGWVGAPGGFAFCLDYPGGIGTQLTCYSPVSGWVVNIPASVPPGMHPSARKVEAVVGRSRRALKIEPGSTWYDSLPERTAEVVCQTAKRFFRCDVVTGGGFGVWFKPNGTFVLYKHLRDPNTGLESGTSLVYGSR